MTELAGKVVWITGASGGIGEALATVASQRGGKLVLSARRSAELDRVRKACANPDQVAVMPLDLTAFDPNEAAKAAASHFGPVDVLVNNAGMSQRSLVRDSTMDVYRHLFELDFFAPVALTKAVLDGMIERRSGHIVVISSVVGYIGTPLRSGYAAAKHALHGFFDAARAELWRDGLKFTLACPGFIKTEVSINAITATGGSFGKLDPTIARGMEPKRCAEKIWRAVERDAEEVFVGKESALIYIKRWIPALASFAVKRAKF
ncbi:MAG TPA: SDR family NAD(P)-dependent oxidoreductase [Nevskiaceae bacterium]|nr:SDR family NAD(P)-dependent oxidoreductase [Nevskiaceae bacterium]